MSRLGQPRIAVLGGGPVGLEAALHATSLGLPVTLFEAGQPAEFVSRWAFIKMFTPFGLNATPLGKSTIATRSLPADTDLLTGREFRDAYLVPLAQSEPLKSVVRPQSTVLMIGRTGWRKSEPADGRTLPPFRLLVRGANNAETAETADVVLDCTGTYGRPNWLGDGGLPALGELASRQHVAYWPEDVKGAKKANYTGRSVIVVGSGHSAATAVCDLCDVAAENASTWVIWLTANARTQPILRVANDPLRDRDRLAVKANALATRGDGNVEHHAGVRIEEVVCPGPEKGFRVTGRVAGKVQTWEAERLIANVGYKPDLGVVSELRVTEPAGVPVSAEPGYHILGAKAAGRGSGFLLRDAQAQIRQAFAEITARSKAA